MANCQNHMRYRRQPSMYPQRNTCTTSRTPTQNSHQNTCQNSCQNACQNTCQDSCQNACQNTCQDSCQIPASNPCTNTQSKSSMCTEKPKSDCNVHIHKEYHCHCPNTPSFPLKEMPIAMAYVPWQKWQKIYDVCEGFQRGTIFSELDKTFHGKGGCNR